MKIFLIPGLGYDHRIFENLDLSTFDAMFINWLEPSLNESIRDYAKRISEKIENTDKKIILIGHSLGGIISQEIASFRKIDKIILISSIKSRRELPFFFKIIKPLRLDKFFTKELSIKTVKYWGKSHGFHTPQEHDLFKSMVGNQTNTYLQWALRALSAWQTPSLPKTTKLIQIHGTDDKTFPFKLINHPDIILEQGSHIMVYKQGPKMTDLIIKGLT